MRAFNFAGDERALEASKTLVGPEKALLGRQNLDLFLALAREPSHQPATAR